MPSPLPTDCTCPVHGQTVAPSSAPDDWLTPDEVVALVRGALSLGTLRNYRSARLGPEYVRVGRTIFYPRAGVDAWLAKEIAESQARWNDRS